MWSISPLLWQAMAFVGASALRDASLTAPPKASWKDVAGDPGGAKTALQQAIEWPRTRAKAYKQLGLCAPRGILMYGPPGCAKVSFYIGTFKKLKLDTTSSVLFLQCFSVCKHLTKLMRQRQA
jgi:ATP-dependent Zn protease